YSLTREQECDRILQVYGTDFEGISVALDRQFRTLHNRAELLLGICGVLVSASVLITTGRFIGGRLLLADQPLAGDLLGGAGILAIAAAVIVLGRVLNIRWNTQLPGADMRSWILNNLAHRDKKTRAYRMGTVFVMLSMVAYQIAISVALIQL